jgi:hypothetical protein
MEGDTNVPGGLRPTNNGEGHLPDVAVYTLYIEDCLCSLVFGPWENLDFRKHWCKCLEQVSTAKEIGQSFWLIALATGWTKHADDFFP